MMTSSQLTYIRDEAETEDFVVVMIHTEQHGSSVGSQGLELLQGTVQCLRKYNFRTDARAVKNHFYEKSIFKLYRYMSRINCTGLSTAGSTGGGESDTVQYFSTILYLHFRNSREGKSTSEVGNPRAPHPLNNHC